MFEKQQAANAINWVYWDARPSCDQHLASIAKGMVSQLRRERRKEKKGGWEAGYESRQEERRREEEEGREVKE